MSAPATIPAITPAAPRPGSSPADSACDAAAFVALLAGLVPATALHLPPASSAAADVTAPPTIPGAEGCARASAAEETCRTATSVIGGAAGAGVAGALGADMAGTARTVTPAGAQALPSTPRNPVQTGWVDTAVPSAPGESIAAPPTLLVLATPMTGRAPRAWVPAPPGLPDPTFVAGPVAQPPTTARPTPVAAASGAPEIDPERTGPRPAVATPVARAEAGESDLRPAPRVTSDQRPVLAPAPHYPEALPVATGAAPTPTAMPAAPSAAAIDRPHAVGTMAIVGMGAEPTPRATPSPAGRPRIMPPSEHPAPQPAVAAPSRPADPASPPASAPIDPSAADPSALTPRTDVPGAPGLPAPARVTLPDAVPERIARGGSTSEPPAPEAPVVGPPTVGAPSDTLLGPRAGLGREGGDESGAGEDAGPAVAGQHDTSQPPVVEPAATAAVTQRSTAEPNLHHAPAPHTPLVRVHLPELPPRTEAAGVHRVHLEVDPPELGRCELELTLRDGTVRAVVVAERADTVVALREVEGQVRAALADRHLQMTDFDVRHGGGGGDAGGAPRQDVGAQPPRPTPRLGPVAEPSVPPSSPRAFGPARRVDLIA